MNRLKIIYFPLLVLILCSWMSSTTFSSEDIHQLVAQGHEFLAQANFQNAFSVALKIIDADPKNENGYLIALSSCFAAGQTMLFITVLDAARQHDIDQVDEMAAKILYAGNWLQDAEAFAIVYEKKWLRKYGGFF